MRSSPGVRAAAVALALGALAMSCATSTDGATRPDPRGASWVGEATFDQPLHATVDSIAWTDDGYVAMGSGHLPWADRSALQAWRSDDGLEWTQIFLETVPCCGRDEREVVVMASNHGLLAWTTFGGLTEVRSHEWYQASFLRSSDDGGRTWTEHTDGPWNRRGTRVLHLHPAGSTVFAVASTTDAPTTGAGPQAPSLWRSSDLATWEEIELPEAPADGWHQVAALDERTVLVSTSEQFGDDRRWYLSDDGGASFGEVDAPHPERSAALLGVAGGRFVVSLDASPDEWEAPDDARHGPVLATSADGRRWDVPGRNTGLFGDGEVRVRGPMASVDGSDTTYLLFARTVRADIRYCLADVTTCRQHEVAVGALGGDGTVREVVIDTPPIDPPANLVVEEDGALLMWSTDLDPRHRSFTLRVRRWDALGGALHVPAPLEAPPAPPTPVRHLHRDTIEVGERFSTQLPVGGCGGTGFWHEDRWFASARTDWPPTDEMSDTWPFLPFEGHDGPSGWLFIEGERTEADQFRFFVDDDTVLEYHRESGKEPTVWC